MLSYVGLFCAKLCHVAVWCALLCYVALSCGMVRFVVQCYALLFIQNISPFLIG